MIICYKSYCIIYMNIHACIYIYVSTHIYIYLFILFCVCVCVDIKSLGLTMIPKEIPVPILINFF